MFQGPVGQGPSRMGAPGLTSEWATPSHQEQAGSLTCEAQTCPVPEASSVPTPTPRRLMTKGLARCGPQQQVCVKAMWRAADCSMLNQLTPFS